MFTVFIAKNPFAPRVTLAEFDNYESAKEYADSITELDTGAAIGISGPINFWDLA